MLNKSVDDLLEDEAFISKVWNVVPIESTKNLSQISAEVGEESPAIIGALFLLQFRGKVREVSCERYQRV